MRGGQEGKMKKDFIKISSQKRELELQVTKIDDKNHQVLFVFKEVSSYKKLQYEKTKEKFTNLFLNTTAHNLFTPINGLIGIS
jgi:nitrogen-specific signal transduction histidine kinase